MTHAAGVQVPRGTIELGARVVRGASTVDAYHDRSAFVPLLQEASGILARQHRDGCTTCQSTGAAMVDGKWGTQFAMCCEPTEQILWSDEAQMGVPIGRGS